MGWDLRSQSGISLFKSSGLPLHPQIPGGIPPSYTQSPPGIHIHALLTPKKLLRVSRPCVPRDQPWGCVSGIFHRSSTAESARLSQVCPQNCGTGGNRVFGGKGSHCLVLPLGSILGKCSAAFWDNSSPWLLGHQHPSGVGYSQHDNSWECRLPMAPQHCALTWFPEILRCIPPYFPILFYFDSLSGY